MAILRQILKFKIYPREGSGFESLFSIYAILVSGIRRKSSLFAIYCQDIVQSITVQNGGKTYWVKQVCHTVCRKITDKQKCPL